MNIIKCPIILHLVSSLTNPLPPPQSSPTLHHINWITNPTTLLPPPHRTFQLFPERGREQMTGLWRPVRHRAIMRQLSYITQKHGFYSSILRLRTHTLISLSHLFCCVLIIIWWFWIKRSQLLCDLQATMTQMTFIYLENISVFF
jgi:hypothetical protein